MQPEKQKQKSQENFCLESWQEAVKQTGGSAEVLKPFLLLWQTLKWQKLSICKWDLLAILILCINVFLLLSVKR